MRIAVIGGGPAGLAAALEAQKCGAEAVVFDRLAHPGGILNQCIHSGFGLRLYGEEWTGPEFAERILSEALDAGVLVRSETEVVEVTRDRLLTVRGEKEETFRADAVVFANGCWERNRGLLPGTRPSGIFSAGEAQAWVNLHGFLPGKRVLILGSGDIGLIMARRMHYQGAEVLGVAEIGPFVSGNTRNQIQCLEENGIPLWLEHSAVRVHGTERLEGVTLARFSEGKPVSGTERFVSCDTLLLSVGLVPEVELAAEVGIQLDPVTGGAIVDQRRATSLEGFYACGNALHVHDLVDNVVLESRIAGKSAAEDWLRKEAKEIKKTKKTKKVRIEGNVRYVVPQVLSPGEAPLSFYLRVSHPTASEAMLSLLADGEVVLEKRSVFKPGEMVEIHLNRAQSARVLAAKEVLVRCEG
ncbi:MAG: NAD(P)/FAD-dependent oxidoreductase [Bacteroidota bacterium]